MGTESGVISTTPVPSVWPSPDLLQPPRRPLQRKSAVCGLNSRRPRPAFRRRGYGSSAIHSLADRTREIDCNELWVYTDSSDEAARHFYTKVGFPTSRIGTRLRPRENDGRLGRRPQTHNKSVLILISTLIRVWTEGSGQLFRFFLRRSPR
jgi:Acetyltransferase (GNAT) family